MGWDGETRDRIGWVDRMGWDGTECVMVEWDVMGRHGMCWNLEKWPGIERGEVGWDEGCWRCFAFSKRIVGLWFMRITIYKCFEVRK